MKLNIQFKNKNSRIINLCLPNGLIKTRIFWNILFKKRDQKSEDNIKVKNIKWISKKIYKELKKFIKQNGHFTFLEIDTEQTTIKMIV